MTIWILRQPQTPTQETKELILPFNGLPDLSGVRSQGDMQRLLFALSPDATYETITRQAEIHWRNLSELLVNDLVLVPLTKKGEYALAEVATSYRYSVENGEDFHSAEIRWLHLYIAKRKLTMLKDEGFAMQKVDDAAARKQVFALTPSSTNHFVRWQWLVVLLFIMQLTVMMLGMWKQ